MTGQFKITYNYLKEIGARDKGLDAFREGYPVEKYPEGVAYQDLLDRCAEKYPDFGEWLLIKMGATDDVRVFDEPVNNVKEVIIFAGSLVFGSEVLIKSIIAGGDIEANSSIKAGEHIMAGDGIKAGLSIEAGDGIRAERSVKAGANIKAGISIRAGWEIKAGLDIEAGWEIKANLGIIAGRHIEAGRNIEARKGIKAGRSIKAVWGIKAGECIEAGKRIEAGKDHCIFAGLEIRPSLWPKYARVVAEQKPANLMSGYWIKNTDK